MYKFSPKKHQSLVDRINEDPKGLLNPYNEYKIMFHSVLESTHYYDYISILKMLKETTDEYKQTIYSEIKRRCISICSINCSDIEIFDDDFIKRYVLSEDKELIKEIFKHTFPENKDVLHRIWRIYPETEEYIKSMMREEYKSKQRLQKKYFPKWESLIGGFNPRTQNMIIKKIEETPIRETDDGCLMFNFIDQSIYK